MSRAQERRELKEKKKEERREQFKQRGENAVESFRDTVNNEKKSNTVLIIAAVIVLILFGSGWLHSHHSNPEDVMTPDGADYGTEETDSDVDVEETKYSLHDEKVIGMWGSEETKDFDSLEDYTNGSWTAYYFLENGTAIFAMGGDGETMSYDGTWSTNKDGDLLVDWKDGDGQEFYSDEIIYEVKDGKLILNDEEYTPIGEATIFS